MMIHKRIKDLIRGVGTMVITKGLIGILVSISYIIQAIFLGKIVSSLYTGNGINLMSKDLLVIVSMLLIRILLLWFSNVYGKMIVGKVKNSLRKRAYRKLLDLGPGFMTENRTGKIESTIVAGVDYLEGYLTLYIPQIMVCIFGSGAMLIYIFHVHIVLGIISLTTFLVAIFSPMFFVSVISKFTEEHWASYMDLNAEIVDTIQGILTLKAFNAAKRIGVELKQKMHKLFQKTMDSLKVNLLDVGISEFASSLGSAFTLGLAAYYTAKGDIEISQLSVLLFLTNEVFRPVNELALYFHQGFMGMTSTDGLIDLFDSKLFVLDEGNKKLPLSENAPSINFENVSFNYPNSDNQIFKNLNIKIQAGEKLAVVGESGSGKTTLINLALRFYDPQKGSIEYNGIDVKDIPLENLRKQFAVVSQDTYLFNGTVEDNLRLAKEDATMEEIISATKAARIHDFFESMPNGYKTHVGERGLSLSGGQRQRVAIARALLKGASFIILDEATSSVDIENEKLIQEALEELLKNKTSITIAHRLSTIKNADRILVLRNGQIVEEGKHENLISTRGFYYNLVLAQGEGF